MIRFVGFESWQPVDSAGSKLTFVSFVQTVADDDSQQAGLYFSPQGPWFL